MGRTAGAYSRGGTCRPFDARRDGMVMGEGAAVVVIEDPTTAAGREAPVLAEILGFGATTDAHHLSAPEPDGVNAARAIRKALADAGLAPEDIDYVNAHGTSTVLNDRAETAALKAALGPAVADLPVSSTKSVIGHLIGAAGAVELAVTVEALRAGIAPPTVGHEIPEPGLDLNYVAGPPQRLGRQGARGRDRLVALSNSLGFGGHNAVLCVAARPTAALSL
jgi:3-oxoacyl-[acyl-carrier-protein] synthase II